jgi:intracellular sulfur oxidation DsrE/DsrF family protein
MKTAYLVTKPWLGTVDPEDADFGREMLAKFLGQLAGAPERPSAVCFYTSGVTAATRGVLHEETLEELARAGVPVLVCGTCVEHYGIGDRLVAGGEVADMKSIAGALGGAEKVITI